MLQAIAEQRMLRLSIGVTVIVSLLGVVYGFKTYTGYVAKVGLVQFIEIHVAVPTGMRLDNVATVSPPSMRSAAKSPRRSAATARSAGSADPCRI